MLTCEDEAISAVLVGNFNPSIFHPVWLERHGLVRAQEARNATIQIIHPEISSFTVGPFHIQVDLRRLKVESEDPGQVGAVKDLTNGMLSLLEHTPVSQFGINRSMHFRVESEENRQTIGDRLAPKDPFEGLVENPRMLSLKVIGERPGNPRAKLHLQVEPSSKLRVGVLVASNEHYDFQEAEADLNEVMRVFSAEWQTAQTYARKTAESLLRSCLEPRSEQ